MSQPPEATDQPPEATEVSQSYDLSKILMRICFVAFCQLHELSDKDENVEMLARLHRYIRKKDIRRDVALTSQQLKPYWPRLDAAFTLCRSPHATPRDLRGLMNTVLEMGGDLAGFTCQLDVDGRGKVHVERLPFSGTP